MCGIIGYIVKQRAIPIVLDGLNQMEYRGYDSSGVAVLERDGSVTTVRAVGRIANLEEKLMGNHLDGVVAVGHSRWATHGGVTEANAHPHSDCKGAIHLVHNGIVENYKELKAELTKKGHTFTSETD